MPLDAILAFPEGCIFVIVKLNDGTTDSDYTPTYLDITAERTPSKFNIWGDFITTIIPVTPKAALPK